MTRFPHSPDEDQNLLLLAHGALPLWPRLRTRLHLFRCAECRARTAHLTRTSALLASAVRGSALPPWSRADAVARHGGRSVLPVPLWVVAVALAVLTTVLFVGVRNTYSAHPAARPTAGGCRPDLPNSRCR